MTNHLVDHLEKMIEVKATRREKKNKTKMKVSGASVKKLQRLIANNAKLDK